MSRRYYISGSVSDGAYVSPEMGGSYASTQVHVDFFDVSGNEVVPTAGMVRVEVSPDGVDYRPIPHGHWDAEDNDRASRIEPASNGYATYCRVILSGIAGAASFRATVIRSEGDISSNLPLTAPDLNVGRVPVDVGSTGFFAGQQLRFFYEFNIPVGESRWIKAALPVDSTLTFQGFEVDDGALRFRAWRGATDVGPWAAPASPSSGVFNRNQVAADQYDYTLQSVIEIGGNGAATTAGATVSEVARIRSAGATAQKATVGETITSERGIPAGTYHIQLENISGSGATTGVYTFNLEERSGLITY